MPRKFKSSRAGTASLRTVRGAMNPITRANSAARLKKGAASAEFLPNSRLPITTQAPPALSGAGPPARKTTRSMRARVEVERRHARPAESSGRTTPRVFGMAHAATVPRRDLFDVPSGQSRLGVETVEPAFRSAGCGRLPPAQRSRRTQPYRRPSWSNRCIKRSNGSNTANRFPAQPKIVGNKGIGAGHGGASEPNGVGDLHRAVSANLKATGKPNEITVASAATACS